MLKTKLKIELSQLTLEIFIVMATGSDCSTLNFYSVQQSHVLWWETEEQEMSLSARLIA